MDPTLRLGVELPPVPAAGSRSLDPWWDAAGAAVGAGAGVVWFTGGAEPAGGGLAERAREPLGTTRAPATPLWADACTVAAAAVARISRGSLGVVSAVPTGRHPAVLAREVTTLDILSAGRGAMCLRWSPEGHHPKRTDPAGAYVCLGEALAVCRAVLRDEDPVFEGRCFHVAGAVNLPRPWRSEGPAILVEVPPAGAWAGEREPGMRFFLDQAARAAAGLVCTDDPGEIARWRAVVDDVVAGEWGAGAAGSAPEILCRVVVPCDDVTEVPPAPTRSRLEAARAAGASGVVVSLRAPGIASRPDGSDDRKVRGAAFASEPAASGRLSAAVSACFAPWRVPAPER